MENADLRPYGEVAQAARGYLQAARQIAGSNSFTIPAGWMGTSVSSDEPGPHDQLLGGPSADDRRPDARRSAAP